MNPTVQDISMKQGTHLGEFYFIAGSSVQHIKQDPGESDVPSSHDAAPPLSLRESPISTSDRAKLLSLLQEYSNIFNSSGQNTGKCMLIQHYIRTSEHACIKQWAYCALPKKQTEIERQVAGLLTDGIIKESCSTWASPVMLVKKKFGAWHFCVDYRRLNSVTIQDSHPLLRVDETLDALAGPRWFSTLDISNSYW